MSGAEHPVQSHPAHERFRLVETAARGWIELTEWTDTPFETLRARGVVRDVAEYHRFLGNGPLWFLSAPDDQALAFFLLVEEAQAASEAALAAAPSPSSS